MKIKYNIPMINNMKEKIDNVRNKMKNNNKTKIPKRNYALLFLMILLGAITLSNNINEYNKSNTEDYTEYELEEGTPIDSNEVENIIYETAESSISTTEPSEEETIETISANTIKSYIMPLDGDIIKDYAKDTLVYSKTLDMWKTHPGIDIKGELGKTVVSVSDGEVIEIEEHSFYGNTVKITNKEGYTFMYSNLDKEIEINKGDKVKEGDKIGAIGVSATGELADEAHLHFEILKDGEHINPIELLDLQ